MQPVICLPLFAALASATATPSRTSSAPFLGPSPPHDGGEFSVGFTLGRQPSAPIFETYAQANDTDDPYYRLFLQGYEYQPGDGPGSGLYFNGTNPYAKALNIDNTGVREPRGIFVATLPNVGPRDFGVALPVLFATGAPQDFAWTNPRNGTIGHRRAVGNQAFFACNQTANFGDYEWLLTFGTYRRDGRTPPKGCLDTRVVQIFDQPGGPEPNPDE